MTRKVGSAVTALLVVTVAAAVVDTDAPGGSATLAAGPGAAVVLPAPADVLTWGVVTDEGLDTVWTAYFGGLATVEPHLDGRAALTHKVALPGVDPVAVASDVVGTFVLDRASETVRVYGGDAVRGFSLQASLAVGNHPTAMSLWDLNGDERTDIAVTNEASNDVSIILSGPAQSYLAQRRVGVGLRPRALKVGDYDHQGGLDLAVANFGSNSVSILAGDEHGSFVRRRDIRVGAGPVAFAPDYDPQEGGSVDVDRDAIEDIVVANSLDGTVSVLLGTDGLPRAAPRVPLPGGASSRPVAVGYAWSPFSDYGTDLFVADRGTGEVLSIHVTPYDEIGRARRVFAIARPVALLVGSFGGNHQMDVAVADESGAVRLISTPGARLVAADPRVATIAAHDGVLVWSRRAGPHRYRLATTLGGRIHDVPVRSSRHDPRPRVGASIGGATVVTRRVCGRRRCALFEWKPGARRERPIHIRIRHGCTLRDFAEWRGTILYLLGSERPGSCRRARGLWMRAGARDPWKLSASAYRLGDLRGGWASWLESPPRVDGWRLRIWPLHGPPITAATGNFDCCDLDGALIDGSYVYWTESPDSVTATLDRAPLSPNARSACEYLPPVSGLPYYEIFAIDDGRPFYVDHALGEFIYAGEVEFGIFDIPPERSHWRKC
jgi:hypothetical protein